MSSLWQGFIQYRACLHAVIVSVSLESSILGNKGTHTTVTENIICTCIRKCMCGLINNVIGFHREQMFFIFTR